MSLWKARNKIINIEGSYAIDASETCTESRRIDFFEVKYFTLSPNNCVVIYECYSNYKHASSNNSTIDALSSFLMAERIKASLQMNWRPWLGDLVILTLSSNANINR